MPFCLLTPSIINLWHFRLVCLFLSLHHQCKAPTSMLMETQIQESYLVYCHMYKLYNFFLPFSLAASIQESIWQCHAWVVRLRIWALRYRDCTVLKSYFKAVIYGVYKAPRPWRPSSLQAAASYSFLQSICNQAERTAEHCSYSHPAQSCSFSSSTNSGGRAVWKHL